MTKLMKSGIAVMISLITIYGTFTSSAAAAEYSLDPTKSELVVRLSKTGFASALAHDHVIRATEYSGHISIESEENSTGTISVTVQTGSLIVDEPAIRKKYGLAKIISEKDRRKIQATMESPAQMDIKKYRTMTFQSTGVEKKSENLYTITGNLTIHGVTRIVSFLLTVQKEGVDLHGKATIPFRQSDFGITPYGAMFGMVRNQDEATLHLDVNVTPTVSPLRATGSRLRETKQ